MTQEETSILVRQAYARNYLKDTDWVIVKIAEGACTKEKYAEVIKKRVEARKIVNEITEEEYASLLAKSHSED